MHETPYADINRLLESLLSHLGHILQERLAGLYLYGSLTAGDFDYEISDIDLLAVTLANITPKEFEALDTMHQVLAHDNPDWEDRVDVAYLSVAALRDYRSDRSPIAVISSGEPFHMRDNETARDWLQNWYIVRESGVALFGPPATTLIPPITQGEFLQAIRDYAAEIIESVKPERDRKSQAYAILMLCRTLHTLRQHKQASKRQAALWAQEELPEWSGLIRSALAWRQAWREEQVDHAATYAETLRFVNFVKSLILV